MKKYKFHKMVSFFKMGMLGTLVLIAHIPLKGQDLNVSQLPHRVTLTEQDISNICTLTSTDIDAFYYVEHQETQVPSKTVQQRAVNFQIEYFVDDDGPDWPQEAKTAFEYALSIWASHIQSDIPIRIQANWTVLPEFVLGSAGPTQIVQVPQGESQTWYPIALASAISGVDYVAQTQGTAREINHDIVVNMNANWDSWYFGTDAQTPSGEIDFVTVVLHELGHGLGFTGSMSSNGGSVAQYGYGTQSLPIIYDKFVYDGNEDQLVDPLAFGNPSGDLYNAVTGLNGGIYFAGIHTISSNNGEQAALFAPSDWSPGSSFSHLDLFTYTDTNNSLMRPSLDRAYSMHTPGPVTCGIFKDEGWPMGAGCSDLLNEGARLDMVSTELDFGVTNVSSQVQQGLMLSNRPDATSPLVARAEVTGGNLFRVADERLFISLEPGESTSIALALSPSLTGKLTGEIGIYHNAPNVESPLLVKLMGEALPENTFYKLDHNYPNPFNATTHIPYALSKTVKVVLEVFDVTGKRVQQLVNEEQSPGRYIVPFTTQSAATGIYYYRLTIDGISSTKKLLLVK